jgi:small GTP-binding protein
MGGCSSNDAVKTPFIPSEAIVEVSNRLPREVMYKTLLIGESGVGKSSLILRHAENQFSEAFISTIGVDFKIRDFNVNGDIVKLQIWDTAGQERFRAITHSFFKGANAIIIVYDITKSDSLEHVKSWIGEIANSAPLDVKKILVGNKSDLEQLRLVPKKMGQALAKQYNMPFFETSAKSNTNIAELFQQVAVLCHSGFTLL